MIIEFLAALWITLVLVRLNAHLFHDRRNYGKLNESSTTITGILRRKTGFDWHHIHFGFIILIISFFLFLNKGLSDYSLILAGIGLSMIFDQLLPWLNLGNYFSNKMLTLSIILHIIISVIAIYFLL